MFSIIISRTNNTSKPVFGSSNYMESLAMLESIALDYIVEKQGIDYLACGREPFYKKSTDFAGRGLFAVKMLNSVQIFEKKKGGLLYSGAVNLLVTFELFTVRNLYRRIEPQSFLIGNFEVGECEPALIRSALLFRELLKKVNGEVAIPDTELENELNSLEKEELNTQDSSEH